MAISVFYGDNRVKTDEAIQKKLGKDREVFEGEGLTVESLPSLFFGTMLFATEKRRILIKDLGENKEVFAAFAEKIDDYVKTDADVVLWETKFDKRTVSAKKILNAGVDVKEFKSVETVDMKAVFNIFDTALSDGKKAVEALERIESSQDPYMFFGLMISQALRKLERKPNGNKEKAILKKLSEVDMQMKSTAVEPWMLIKSFLLTVSSL